MTASCSAQGWQLKLPALPGSATWGQALPGFICRRLKAQCAFCKCEGCLLTYKGGHRNFCSCFQTLPAKTPCQRTFCRQSQAVLHQRPTHQETSACHPVLPAQRQDRPPLPSMLACMCRHHQAGRCAGWSVGCQCGTILVLQAPHE